MSETKVAEGLPFHEILEPFEGYECDGCAEPLLRGGESLPSSRWRYVDGKWQHSCKIDGVPGAGHIGRAVAPLESETRRVYRVELMIVDHDDIGPYAVENTIEHTRYPNRCIRPKVVQVDVLEVEWSDRHPLNMMNGWEAEYRRLFSGTDEG